MSVSRLLIHPEFQYSNSMNDIALLRLSSLVPFQRRISPICLPTPDENYENRLSTIVSYAVGSANENDDLSTCKPRKIDLPIMESGFCTRIVDASQGCVGVIGTPSVLCKVEIFHFHSFRILNFYHFNRQDDVGSAIMFNRDPGYYELIGILSDQQSCNANSKNPSVRDPAIYTKISSLQEWILDNTKDSCYCRKI